MVVAAALGVGAALAAAREGRAGTSPAPTPRGGSSALSFPRDHGSHPSENIEWWYYTGNLTGSGGREYGFELVFFRLRRFHLAHFAWTDVSGKTFRFDERAHLELPGIAQAKEGGLDVSNEGWSAREKNGVHELHAESDGADLTLALTPAKPPVVHGEGGIARKGPGADEYSHYVSITRLAVRGTRSAGGKAEALSGTAWFDHEWGPGALPADAAGWDWFSLPLSDGSELMLYRMRRADGTATPFSSGTFIPPAGPPRRIAWSDVALSPIGEWRSPRSGARYPSNWELSVKSFGLAVRVVPALADQELVTEKSTGVTYWEGSCRIEGTRGGHPIRGRGYVELTGYAGRDVPGFTSAPASASGPSPAFPASRPTP